MIAMTFTRNVATARPPNVLKSQGVTSAAEHHPPLGLGIDHPSNLLSSKGSHDRPILILVYARDSGAEGEGG